MSDKDFYGRVDGTDLYQIAVVLQARCVRRPTVEACLDAVVAVLDRLDSDFSYLSKVRFMARLTDHAWAEMLGGEPELFKRL